MASQGLAEEIEQLRSEPGEGDIAIGGATPATEAASLGLIDEYRARVNPVLVGGGRAVLPRGDQRIDSELVGTSTFSSKSRLPGLPGLAVGGSRCGPEHQSFIGDQ